MKLKIRWGFYIAITTIITWYPPIWTLSLFCVFYTIYQREDEDNEDNRNKEENGNENESYEENGSQSENEELNEREIELFSKIKVVKL